MTLFGFALELIEICAMAVFLIAMVIGVALDRRNIPDIKWWVLFIGAATALFFTKNSWTLPTLLEFAASSIFWLAAMKYLGLGLLYSCVEFIVEVRKSATSVKQMWERFLDTKCALRDIKGVMQDTPKLTVREVLPIYDEYDAKAAEEKITIPSTVSGIEVRKDFINDLLNFHLKNGIVKLKLQGKEIVPSVDTSELTNRVGSWAIFWPFYMLSMIIGDLLTQIFTVFASFLTNASSRFVNLLFKDAFKI